MTNNDFKNPVAGWLKQKWVRHLFVAAVLSLGAGLLGGCDIRQAEQDAKRVVERHYRAISANNYNAVLADYGPEFFRKTRKDEWTTMLSRVNARLGGFSGYRVVEWNVSINSETGIGSTTHVVLTCEATYSTYPVREQFTLLKGSGDRDYKIVGHDINAYGRLK